MTADQRATLYLLIGFAFGSAVGATVVRRLPAAAPHDMVYAEVDSSASGTNVVRCYHFKATAGISCVLLPR